MDVLQPVATHLADIYPHVGVGERPTAVPDGMAWATIWNTDARPPLDANDIDRYDVALSTIVQVKTIGWTWRQVADVGRLLDGRIRDGLTIDGRAVHLVIRDRASGPTRDEARHPEPGLFVYDQWFRIDHAPDLADAS